jgi:CheY-like chemotaxis protein
MTHSTILLVEDDPNDVFFFERAVGLASIIHPLRVVGDGRQALAYLAGDPPYGDRDRFPPPALVVLDLNLPQRTGLEVLRWIREYGPYPDVPVVVLTSSTAHRDKQVAKSLGANAYLSKPSDPDLLVELVRGLKRDWLDCSPEPSDGNTSAG